LPAGTGSACQVNQSQDCERLLDEFSHVGEIANVGCGVGDEGLVHTGETLFKIRVDSLFDSPSVIDIY